MSRFNQNRATPKRLKCESVLQVMVCLLVAAHSAQAWTDRDGNQLPETGLLGRLLRLPMAGPVLRYIIQGM
jgi:hypothetical protein